MIYGWDGAAGSLAAILGIVIHIAFAAMVVMSAIWLFRALFSGTEQFVGSHKAEIILKQRYAKGELSREDYHHMKRDISSSS